MQFSSPDFTAPVRTLTALGLGAMTPSFGQNVTLAATSTVQFNTSVNQGLMNAIGVVANAGGTILIQMFDGTNTITVTTVAISTSAVQDNCYGNNLVFWQIHNNSASAATYLFSGMLWKAA